MTRTATAPRTNLVPVVVVTCACGFYPLDKAVHANSTDAWAAAAAHVALNPTKCTPNMSRDLAPAALAPAAR